jgi:N-acetylmuramoyl-L-alanine amidase
MKICIDPGHGRDNKTPESYDPGVVASDGTEEATIALEWALTGKWVLTQAGIPVYLTRVDDRDSEPLGQRDEKAEWEGCSHYLSVHVNDLGTPKARGIEAFYRDINDMHWASVVLNSAYEAMRSLDDKVAMRGLKRENESQHRRLSVFDFDGPCALLELGNITNAADLALIRKRETRIAFWTRFLQKVEN